MKNSLHYCLIFGFYLFSLSFVSGQNINQLAKEHIVQNKAQYNLTDDDIKEFRITKNYVSSLSGVRHVHGIQQHNGIDIDQANFSMHLKDGKIFKYTNNFEPNLNSKITGRSNVSSNSSLNTLKRILPELGITNYGTISIDDKKLENIHIFNGEGGSLEDATAQLQYYKDIDQKRILAWHFTIRQVNHGDSWNVIVDASTNKIINKWDLKLKCSEVNHSHNHNELSTYGPVFENNDSVEEVTNYLMPLDQSYEVFAHPIQNPTEANFQRTIEVNPYNTTASPDGWHHIVGDGDYFTTKGNNIDAYSDGNASFRPVENDLNFVDYPFYNTYTVTADRAAVTNAFYWANLSHDIFYVYGFDEAAGNFQQHNYTPLGAGGDAITVLTHSGSCASFYEPVSSDGLSPTIKISTCNRFGSNMDGAYDNWVMVHEYAHGVVNRIIGNNHTVQNPEHMDEGWADWFGMMLTMNHEEGQLPNRIRPLGVWHEGNHPAYALRTYDANRAPNDLSYYNYANLDGLVTTGPNEQGESIDRYEIAKVWGAILWDLTWTLIDDYGFDSDIYYGNGGNNMALKLVMEAMHYTGNTPGFQTGLDGLLEADQDLFNGALECYIKTAFTNRGFGDGALTDIFEPYIDFYHSFNEYPCEESDVSIYITNTDYPTCDEVDYESEDSWFYVTANVLVPETYNSENLASDLNAGNISLELFTAGNVSVSLRTISADNNVATLENNVIELSFPININTFLGIEPNWVRNYDFQINANLNGTVTNHRVSGIDLTLCGSYTCEMNEIIIDTDNFPSCVAPDTPFPLNIGGSFQLVGRYKAVSIKLVITHENGGFQELIIDDFDETSYVALTGYPEGFIGLYDFDLNASDFISGLQGDYTVQAFFYTRVKTTYCEEPVTSQELTISFDCNPNNLCENQLFADSGSIPICPNLTQTDFAFDICGTYCTEDFLSNIQLDIINHDNQISIFNTDNYQSNATGEFCFTINDENFVNGFSGNYDFEITATYQNGLGETYNVETVVSGINFDECNSQSICDINITPEEASEGFETNFGVWTQPETNTINWVRANNVTPNPNYPTPNGGSDGTTWFALLNQENTGPLNTTALVSPCIDLRDMATAQIDFDTFFWGPIFDQQSNLILEISLNNGLSWESDALATVPSLQNLDWGERVVNLTPFVDNEIRLRFVATSNNGLIRLGLDNINLEYTIEQNNCPDGELQITSVSGDCETIVNGKAISVCGTYCEDEPLMNMELDIIDTDTGEIINTLPGNSSIIDGNFCFNIVDTDFINGLQGNYNFTVTAFFQDSNGNNYEVSETTQGVSFDDCEPPFSCKPLTVKLSRDLPPCQKIIDPNGTSICISYIIPQGAATSTLILSFNQIDGPDNFNLIEFNPPTPNQDANGNPMGDFCFTITEDLFQTPIEGMYSVNATIIAEDSAGNSCPDELDKPQTIDFSDCQIDCPDCNKEILANISFTETKTCGVYEFKVPELNNCYKVVYYINNEEEDVLEEGITPHTFNQNGTYTIDVVVVDLETGKNCAKKGYEIRIECPTNVCPDCNKDIFNNITINETKDCGVYEIFVPQLYDCYKVAYTIDNGQFTTLSEGINTITFNENGMYTISYGVIDLDTDKICAKDDKEIKIGCISTQPDEMFITTWKIDDYDPTITIPTFAGETYNYDVDWEGDGVFDDFGVTGDITHDYGEGGAYEVHIRGNFPRIYFVYDRQNLNPYKIVYVNQWGNQVWSSMGSAFANCINLRVIAPDTPDLSEVTDMSNMFLGARSLNESLNNWNVSNVVNMQGLFSGAISFNQPLNNWDVSRVTNMSNMFALASNFNQSLNNWDVRNVQTMFRMFNRTTNFNQFIGNWEFSNGIILKEMFFDAVSFNQPLNSWDVSGVADITGLFFGAHSFNQPLNQWNTSNITNFYRMFYDAHDFDQSLNNWDVSNASNMSGMFSSTINFNQPLNNWDVSNVSNISGMFGSTVNFNQPLNNWDVSNVSNMSGMFSSTVNFNQPLNNWDVSNVSNMSSMFSGADSFNQPLNNWDVSNVSDMRHMFFNSESFNQSLGSWDISNVSDMLGMLSFSGLSTTNYDSILIGWASQNLQTNVELHALNINYCSGAAARQNIINNFNWSIYDASVDPSCRVQNSIKKNNVTVYPNPAENEISLSVEKTKIKTIEISNIYGNTIRRVKGLDASKYTLNVQDYARGFYFIKITTSDGKVQVKNVILK
ncbi:BspA family leucine-rich repeat surface protein [uncultured Winogradskyella sp.]|uniref:BspA family leucine-rich repeat surface protein n=1 Tax=uncultured Winogradskyella sp. TaxID=395353 RepID=UPI002627B000|nr:BspA family leucine-rich repeat surface protein [uncultured Winogradskyella sp.]